MSVNATGAKPFITIDEIHTIHLTGNPTERLGTAPLHPVDRIELVSYTTITHTNDAPASDAPTSKALDLLSAQHTERFPAFEIKPFTTEEREQLITVMLQRAGHEATPETVAAINGKFDGSIRTLRTLVDELR